MSEHCSVLWAGSIHLVKTDCNGFTFPYRRSEFYMWFQFARSLGECQERRRRPNFNS